MKTGIRVDFLLDEEKIILWDELEIRKYVRDKLASMIGEVLLDTCSIKQTKIPGVGLNFSVHYDPNLKLIRNLEERIVHLQNLLRGIND